MNDNAKTPEKVNIPYMVYEDDMARMERQITRLWKVIIFLVIAIIVIVIGFLVYLNQYDFESYEVVSRDGGYASFIGNDGDINYGKSECEAANEEEPQNN